MILEHHCERNDKHLSLNQKQRLTQIMRVKAWVRRGEDAESRSRQTLVIVPRISLSRESPDGPKTSTLNLMLQGWGRGREHKLTWWSLVDQASKALCS